jgi:protein tyrosine phosphatase
MKLRYYVFKCTVSVIVAFFLLNEFALSATQEHALCANNLASPIANFCEVKHQVLWRGAKPNKDEAAWLIKNGVKTIVNLELLYDDIHTLHHAHFTNTGIYQVDYFRVKTWEPLYSFAKDAADEDVIHFLAIAKQAKQPLYIHCRAGENRTGVMVAAYKIILDGQTSPDQIAAILNEMQSYKGVWSAATTEYIEDLSRRRDEILQKVNAFTVEQPTQVVCKNGKCASTTNYFGAGQQ